MKRSRSTNTRAGSLMLLLAGAVLIALALAEGCSSGGGSTGASPDPPLEWNQASWNEAVWG